MSKNDVQDAFKVFWQCCRGVEAESQEAIFCCADLESALAWAKWAASTTWCPVLNRCGHSGVFVMEVHASGCCAPWLCTADLIVAPEQRCSAVHIPDVSKVWYIVFNDVVHHERVCTPEFFQNVQRSTPTLFEIQWHCDEAPNVQKFCSQSS